jgi:hypothetical protein
MPDDPFMIGLFRCSIFGIDANSRRHCFCVDENTSLSRVQDTVRLHGERMNDLGVSKTWRVYFMEIRSWMLANVLDERIQSSCIVRGIPVVEEAEADTIGHFVMVGCSDTKYANLSAGVTLEVVIVARGPGFA